MRNLVLKPEHAEVFYRMVEGDLHMVNDEDHSNAIDILYEYMEEYFDEKYANDEEDNADED